VLNEFKAGMTRQWLPFVHPSFDQGWPAKLGYPAIFPQDQFPPVVISNANVVSATSNLLGIGSASFSAGLRAQQTIQAADSVTILLGRHAIKFGTDQRWTRLNFVNRNNPSGRFDFTTGLTGNPLSPAGTGVGMTSKLRRG
jgi:hypothetical protein